MTAANVQIHELCPARLADFLAFFDGEAFSDNPEWSSCYCQCYYEDHSKIQWGHRTAAQNRACAIERVRHGQMHGLLAYRHAAVVGWCNAAPRALLHVLDAEPVAHPERIGTILCFVVAPSARGQGVATALLDAACRRFAADGFATAQANPRIQVAGAAENHFGFLDMYLSAGFVVSRTDDDASVWVTKALQPAPRPTDPAAPNPV